MGSSGRHVFQCIMICIVAFDWLSKYVCHASRIFSLLHIYSVCYNVCNIVEPWYFLYSPLSIALNNQAGQLHPYYLLSL